MITGKSVIIILFLVFASIVYGVSEDALEFPKIDRKPAPGNWDRGRLKSVPEYDPNSRDVFQVDLRFSDLSKLDLRGSLNALLYATFDDGTTWPAPERMPKNFDWKRFMERGKNPGLGIRALHRRRITGQGVGIAILDQPLLVDHREYADRLRLYEEIDIQEGTSSQMHGPAVASIAVGRTVGVAPEADLYYIGQWNGDWENGEFTYNFQYLAQGVRRILQINEQLPRDKKIRVISISAGWNPHQKGYRQITDAVQEAKAAGMLVICSSTEAIHGFSFLGLGRFPYADPDTFSSYEPGLAFAKYFYEDSQLPSGYLWVPMDSRTTASPTGPEMYVFYRQAGLSWTIPYIAGVYALAAQVEPDITPDRFWALAMKTGRTIQLENKSRKVQLGPIIDPSRLISALKSGDLADKDAVAAVNSAIKDLNGKVAQLNIDTATTEDVIRIFGEPTKYVLGRQTLEKDNLPDSYTMFYNKNFIVNIRKGRVEQLGFHTPADYVYRDTIRFGSTLEEVLKVLGPPKRIVEGKKVEFEDGVLYKDFNGRTGQCWYTRLDQRIKIRFLDYKVCELFLTRTEPVTRKK
jgi:hypothetical protein